MAGRRREGQQGLPPQPPPKALELLSLPLARKPQLSNPLSLAAACRLKLEQSMCALRRLIWLADCWQRAQGGGQLRAERARLPRPRGFALLALQ